MSEKKDWKERDLKEKSCLFVGVCPLCTAYSFQECGIILKNEVGSFPRLVGWCWYLLVCSTFLLANCTHTGLNLARIFLIKQVTLHL